MSVDKFGRFTDLSFRGEYPSVKGIGFNLTTNGDYDMQLKRLVNLNNAVDAKDAVSKAYVDNQIKNLTESMNDVNNSYAYVDGKVDKTVALVNEIREKIVSSETIREYVNASLDALYKKLAEKPDKKKLEPLLRNRHPWAPSLPGTGLRGAKMNENIQKQLSKKLDIV